jgi:hypothetical protein
MAKRRIRIRPTPTTVRRPDGTIVAIKPVAGGASREQG